MIELTLRLLGSLALLIYGMKTMSDSLQKMAGPSLRHILGRMTSNRLSGILTGTMVTCAVQSSSATTVMTVSFVSAGLLTLAQAISVIMGANIGTTVFVIPHRHDTYIQEASPRGRRIHLWIGISLLVISNAE